MWMNLTQTGRDDSSLTIRVDLTGQFQCVRSGQVWVRRRHAQNQRVRVGDEGQDHLLNLSLNIFRLVTYWHLGKEKNVWNKAKQVLMRKWMCNEKKHSCGYLGDSRQVDQGEVENIRGVNLQMDGFCADTLCMHIYDIQKIEEESQEALKIWPMSVKNKTKHGRHGSMPFHHHFVKFGAQ